MVCRVESGMFYLGTWPTNFTSNTKKYKKTAKIHSKCGILTDSTAKKRKMEGFFMAEAKFKRPELTDRDLIDSYFKKYPSRSCDRTFANVYLWARFYEVEFAQYNNVLLFRDNSAGYGYAFPAGEDEDVKAAIEDIMKWEKEKDVPFCLYGVTKENFAKLETWFPGKFDITYHRDEADYVYESEKLATLSGKKLHGKRNHVNKFKALHGDNWSYETITEDNLEECF